MPRRGDFCQNARSGQNVKIKTCNGITRANPSSQGRYFEGKHASAVTPDPSQYMPPARASCLASGSLGKWPLCEEAGQRAMDTPSG
ncbi:hypothetical protein BaRGS_00039431 [Batillaria attramentaria]|uniref:Uncharacterized protein n=1 Tax=Batillaria attramentaria TaxID=370345 RepID=A0ABD0J3W3_9CAEN